MFAKLRKMFAQPGPGQRPLDALRDLPPIAKLDRQGLPPRATRR